MISDSIPNASIAVPSSNPKDFPKKKRANRAAKLKQCKLDARREQWLSQVKNKNECKDELHGGGDTPRGSMLPKNERGVSINKLEIKPRGEEEIYEDGSPMHHHYSDVEYFPSNSPTSHTSSVLCSHDSGINFTASSRSSSTSSGRSISSCSNCFCSGSVSGEDEENVADDDCLDDWEAVADALAATDNNQQKHPNSGPSSPSKKHENSAQESNISNAEQESNGMNVQRNSVNNQAWRADDAFRPLGLPNLTKQYSFPLNSERRFGSVWGSKNDGPVPTPCPICCEDFDDMDSVFHPCSCGFRLCLFCHKRILEGDGRCPACRKQYGCNPVEGETTLDGGNLNVRFAHSYSMVPRS